MRAIGFTVIVDMRGPATGSAKPILKALQELCPPGVVHQAVVVRPSGLWQRQRAGIGSQKYKFEVSY